MEWLISVGVVISAFCVFLPVSLKSYLIFTVIVLGVSLILFYKSIEKSEQSKYVWSITLAVVAITSSLFMPLRLMAAMNLMGVYLLGRSILVFQYNKKLEGKSVESEGVKKDPVNESMIPQKGHSADIGTEYPKQKNVPDIDEIKNLIKNELEVIKKQQTNKDIEQKFAQLEAVIDQLKNRSTQNNKRLIEDMLERLKTEKVDFTNTRTLHDTEIRNFLLKTFQVAQNEIDIISPWLSTYAVNSELINKMEHALKRGVSIKILYGYEKANSVSSKSEKESISDEIAEKLITSFKKYENLFRIKRVITHEKLLICDEKYYLIGSYNLLSFGGVFGAKTRKEIMEYSENIQLIRVYREKYFSF